MQHDLLLAVQQHHGVELQPRDLVTWHTKKWCHLTKRTGNKPLHSDRRSSEQPSPQRET